MGCVVVVMGEGGGMGVWRWGVWVGKVSGSDDLQWQRDLVDVMSILRVFTNGEFIGTVPIVFPPCL